MSPAFWWENVKEITLGRARPVIKIQKGISKK
jgi:hypothetical protein